jgi:hypothetical protein
MNETYPTGDIKADIKTLRVEIDKVISLAQMVRQFSKPNTSPNEHNDFGREISLVITKLQEGKMWAGKCLEMIGSELPKEFQDKA